LNLFWGEGGAGFKLHLQHWTQMLPQVGLTSTSPPVYRGRSRLSEQRELAFTIFYNNKVVSGPNFDTKSPLFSWCQSMNVIEKLGIQERIENWREKTLTQVLHTTIVNIDVHNFQAKLGVRCLLDDRFF
jgi:hypothetical protein